MNYRSPVIKFITLKLSSLTLHID